MAQSNFAMTQKGIQQKYAVEQQIRVAQMLRIAAAGANDKGAALHYRQRVSRLRASLKKFA